MQRRSFIVAITALVFLLALGLGCTTTSVRPAGVAQLTPTPTRTFAPRDSVDYVATAFAATLQAGKGYIITSTPLPVWPTSTPTPFDQVSFLATINAQFARVTETALALATPTFTPSPIPTPTHTPPPPRFLPPAGGSLTLP